MCKLRVIVLLIVTLALRESTQEEPSQFYYYGKSECAFDGTSVFNSLFTSIESSQKFSLSIKIIHQGKDNTTVEVGNGSGGASKFVMFGEADFVILSSSSAGRARFDYFPNGVPQATLELIQTEPFDLGVNAFECS